MTVSMSVLQQLGADALFRPAPEQHPVRQDDGHHALVLEVVKAVQQEGKVSGRLGGEAVALNRTSSASASVGSQR